MTTLVAAGVSHVGNVRTHNEDAYCIDDESSVFIVADGVGGQAAGEIASGIAIEQTRVAWSNRAMLRRRTDYANDSDALHRRELLAAVRDGVNEAHIRILEESRVDPSKRGMGTTFTGFLMAGQEAIFAHAGDSRGYLLRDGINIQLSEDHTLLAQMAARGERPKPGDTDRWTGVLTNALGMTGVTKVATFLLPVYSGDRIVLCTDGIHDYLGEGELGRLVEGAASPALACQALLDVALDRGGADNATVIVVKIVEEGESRVPHAQLESDRKALEMCPLFLGLSPQERVRSLRIALPRTCATGEELPRVALGEPVAHIILEGEAQYGRSTVSKGGVIYPASLVIDAIPPNEPAIARSPCRALTVRRDDYVELTDEDAELGTKLYAALAGLVSQ